MTKQYVDWSTLFQAEYAAESNGTITGHNKIQIWLVKDLAYNLVHSTPILTVGHNS